MFTMSPLDPQLRYDRKEKMKTRPSSMVFFSVVALIIIFLILYWTVFTTTKTINIPGEGTYTGQMKNGQFHGVGTWDSEMGCTYTGEFNEGKYDGQGTLTFANGATYHGGFKEGYMHGHGVMTFTDGSTHEGEWDGNQLRTEHECDHGH